MRRLTQGLNVVGFQVNSGASTLSVLVPANLAGVAVSLEHGPSQGLPSSGIDRTSHAAFPVSMLGTGCNSVDVAGLVEADVPSNLTAFSRKPLVSQLSIGFQLFVNFAPVVVRRMSGLKTHLGNRRVVRFGQARIPSWKFPRLRLSTIGAVTALVFWNAQAPAFAFGTVDREGLKSPTATASAGNDDSIFLSFADTHNTLLGSVDFNPYTGNMEACKQSVNCWDPLRANVATASSETISANAKNTVDWEISSQALQECSEGSTTRSWSPERTVKTQECAPRKGRYSLDSRETVRSADKEPHDNITNAVPYTGKLDDLSEQPVKEIIQKVLKNDAKKTLDKAAYDQFARRQVGS